MLQQQVLQASYRGLQFHFSYILLGRPEDLPAL